LPWISVVRVAAADRDRPNAHIPLIDVPAIWRVSVGVPH
jgi:hypothetical protein